MKASYKMAFFDLDGTWIDSLLNIFQFLMQPFETLFFPQNGLLQDAAVAEVFVLLFFIGKQQLPAGLQVLVFFLVPGDFFLEEPGDQWMVG